MKKYGYQTVINPDKSNQLSPMRDHSMKDFSKLLATPRDTIRSVMRCIDENSEGIALVVGKDNRLIGTVTDGDIRRAILSGMELDLPVQKLLERQRAPHPTPLTAPLGTSRQKLLAMMNRYAIPLRRSSWPEVMEKGSGPSRIKLRSPCSRSAPNRF
jgi:hypothetical protein